MGRRLIEIALLWACLLSIGFGQSLSRISLTPNTVVGGNSATGSVTLAKKAGTGGVAISLSSSLTSVTVPPTVTVPAGDITASFTATTTPISANATASIEAKLGSKTLSAKLTIDAAKLTAIIVSPTQVVGGNPAIGTLSLTGKAPAGGYSVSIGSSSSTVTVPKSVTIPAGALTATFSCTTTPVVTATSISLIAALKGVAQNTKLKVNPPALASLAFSPSTLAGGGTSTGTVSLSGLTVAGVKIALSSASTLVTVPASVNIAAGSESATFTCTTNGVSKSTAVLVKATSSGTSIGTSLTLQPVDLASVTLNPSTVVGGTTATGTVTLNANAPAGGITITLTSSQTAFAVPASVTVPSGIASATFTATTQVVNTQQNGTITATDPLGITQSAGIAVVVQPGLAKSAWPKIHQGALNGGLGLGKGAKGTLAWSFTPLGYPNTGITVGPDGVCYFETAGGYQCAYNPDGSQKWVTKISSGSTANTGSNAAVGPDGTIYVNDTTLSAYTPDGGVKWKSQYGGGANQQPVIGSDGTIYVGTYFETSGLAAINPDGTLKWAFSGVGAASSSPAIGPDGTIYVACSDNKLHAISPSGTELWAFTMGLTLSGSKPALGSDGTIYITTGANQQGSSANIAGFYAVNPDGTSKWSYSVPNTIISSETLGADGTIYIGTNYGNLFALNSDGSTKWQADFGATIWSIMIDPSGTVYVLVAAGGNSVLFAYNADGTLKWRYNALNQYLIYAQMVNGNICLAGQSSLLSDVGPNGVPISTTELFIHVTSSPVLAIDNTIYVGADDGYLHAINPDGSLKWKFATKGVITSSPAIASDGTIYAVTSEGSCYAVASTGTLKWNVSVGWIGQSSPTIGPDGTVYVASAYGVYAINPGGTIKWTCDSVGSTESAPAISADGTLYITTIDDYGNTYLNAVNSVGTLKWKVNIGNAYDWATKLNPSVDPVIGQDGTIYVFSGMNLTVFTPSGSVKWTYPLGPNGGTNPCIGPDGTIYVGSNTANNIDPSCILALNSDGSLKWQYADLAGRYEGDLSVGADGTVYAQPYLSGQAYQSGLIEAINSKGVLKWGLKLPMLLWPYVCSPTIGADGTIYIGGPSLFAIK